jgi:Na+-driven multidrug efflux pump
LNGLALAAVLIISLVIAGVIGHILLIFWIHKDAARYGEESLAWALAASFLDILVLPIYFYMRKQNKKQCARCKNWHQVTLPNCPHCGL